MGPGIPQPRDWQAAGTGPSLYEPGSGFDPNTAHYWINELGHLVKASILVSAIARIAGVRIIPNGLTAYPPVRFGTPFSLRDLGLTLNLMPAKRPEPDSCRLSLPDTGLRLTRYEPALSTTKSRK